MFVTADVGATAGIGAAAGVVVTAGVGAAAGVVTAGVGAAAGNVITADVGAAAGVAVTDGVMLAWEDGDRCPPDGGAAALGAAAAVEPSRHSVNARLHPIHVLNLAIHGSELDGCIP